MVLDQRRVYGNVVTVQLAIDGQQRLTTIQIFLSAFRDVCAAEGQQAYAEECARYLQSTGIMDNEKVEKYKRWPTNLDRKQFTDVFDSASKEELNKRHPIVRRKYQREDDPRPKMIEMLLLLLRTAHGVHEERRAPAATSGASGNDARGVARGAAGGDGGVGGRR